MNEEICNGYYSGDSVCSNFVVNNYNGLFQTIQKAGRLSVSVSMLQYRLNAMLHDIFLLFRGNI